MKNFSSIEVKKMNPWRLLFCFCLLAFIAMNPDFAWANVGFGQMGENVKTNALGVAQGIMYTGFAAGVGMAVWGCFDLYGAGTGRSNASYGKGFGKILVGALLLGLGAFIASGSTTFFGSDQSSGLQDLGF